MTKRILIVEDDVRYGEFLREALKSVGYEACLEQSGREALDRLQREEIALVLSDVKMPEMSGLSLLKEIRKYYEGVEVVILTGYGTVEDAVEALKKGARDYLLKPVNMDELCIKIENILREKALKNEVSWYREEEKKRRRGFSVPSKSIKMAAVAEAVEKVAPTESTVLILGETGTGKELLAQEIHDWSDRREKTFVPVNCAAIPVNLLESELFGHEKGAFTDARSQHVGKFERAIGGTIFLDEIGDMPLTMQAKLLRVLQEKEIERVGGTKPIPVDIRVIAATNCDLLQSVKEGNFRNDLYYRLNVVSIVLPPLRERIEDIPQLADYFLTKSLARERKRTIRFAPEVLECFRKYTWPGNIRELENCIERLVILNEGDVITVKYLPEEILHPVESVPQLQPGHRFLEDVERAHLEEALQRCGGNITKAAQRLGISRDTLRYRMKKYRLRAQLFSRKE